MVVYADIKRIEEHLSILYEELKEIQILSECLNNWYRQVQDNMVKDSSMILKQLNCAHEQEESIQSRILFLEKTADRFLTLSNDIKVKLDSTVCLLQATDDDTYNI